MKKKYESPYFATDIRVAYTGIITVFIIILPIGPL